MARESCFIINCSSFSNSIADFISAMNQIGWRYSVDGQTEYLPVNDNDCFDWQRKYISDNELFRVLEQKQDLNELCGIVLYHKFSDRGVTLLARNTEEIMININVNRKIICGDYTDASWYIENIFSKLEKITGPIEEIKYTDISG